MRDSVAPAIHRLDPVGPFGSVVLNDILGSFIAFVSKSITFV